MNTLYFQRDDLPAAGLILRRGGCVAFPTETVYGLGANALDEQAVEKIFQAKGRPSDNPLIVHIADRRMLEGLTSHVPKNARELMDRFWPGPLTFVLPKSNRVPDSVTAGLPTVAVRMPDHPWALELIRESQVPVAAPSANVSGSPSGTTWQAVRDDLDGAIDAIVCGPPTEIGLESTVLDLTGSVPRILRPGRVSFEELVAHLPDLVNYDPRHCEPQAGRSEPTSLLNSPGLRHRHYQPKAAVLLGDSPPANSTAGPTLYIGISPPDTPAAFFQTLVVPTVDEYAARLFQFFRLADELGAATIVCQPVAEIGIGTALMDRLRRASET